MELIGCSWQPGSLDDSVSKNSLPKQLFYVQACAAGGLLLGGGACLHSVLGGRRALGWAVGGHSRWAGAHYLRMRRRQAKAAGDAI